jgi:hypothetical protein
LAVPRTVVIAAGDGATGSTSTQNKTTTLGIN